MPNPGNSNGSSVLSAPVRNTYFYGKLLDDRHLQLEQSYLNDKRWLLNRLGLGTGVLCGLRAKANDDNSKVLIEPGVAIDARGREIVVTEQIVIDDPWAVTDEHGRPLADPDGNFVTICLAYHECDTEPTPVLVADCEVREGCKPGAVRERYKVLLLDGVKPPFGWLTPQQCAKLFPAGAADRGDHRRFINRELRHSCARAPRECVPIAIVHRGTGGDGDNGGTGIQPTVTHALPEFGAAGGPVGGTGFLVDDVTLRTNVYSNVTLFELILCLARRVDGTQAPATNLLRYSAGDAQNIKANQPAAQPLEVEVVDESGTGVDAVAVTFTVQGGGGDVGQVPPGGMTGTPPAGAGPKYVATSANGGIARVGYWAGAPTSSVDLVTVAASLPPPSTSRIVFHALLKGES